MVKKLKILLVFASLSLTLGLMSNTYSRYIADTTGNIDVVFAKWQILVNNTDITEKKESEITFTPIVEIDNNENIKAGTVAPSSKGHFDINIDPKNVDVSFKYNIRLDLENANIPDLMITNYEIISTDYDGTITSGIKNLSGKNIIDTLTYNEGFQEFTVRVYFEWFEGENTTMSDEDDTNASKNNESFTINAGIHFDQEI